MQSRPGPNGSLDRLMITGMMIAGPVGLGIPGVGRAAGADSRSRTSWQRWLWPGGIHRLGAGAFPASRLTLMTELDSELGSFTELELEVQVQVARARPGAAGSGEPPASGASAGARPGGPRPRASAGQGSLRPRASGYSR